MDELMRTSEAARMLNVHINTVRRWNNHGIIRSYRVGPRQDRRFRREDVLRLLIETGPNGGNNSNSLDIG